LEKFSHIFKEVLKAFGVTYQSNPLYSCGKISGESILFEAPEVRVDCVHKDFDLRATAYNAVVSIRISSDERGRPYVAELHAIGNIAVVGKLTEMSISSCGICLSDEHDNTVRIVFA